MDNPVDYIVIVVIDQPCVLCEQTMEVWELRRDKATGHERYDRQLLEHECEPMRRLLQERRRSAPG